MELGYPNSWAEGQTRALEAFLTLPHQWRKYLLISQQTDNVSALLTSARHYLLLSICSYPICSDWFRNGCSLGPPGLPRAMTWSLGCWAEMETYLGTATALQTTKTHKLLLKAPTSQRPAGSTSGNATRQVACTSWYEVGDPKAVGDLCAGSSSPGMLQGTIGTGTYPPLDSGALLTKLSFPQSLQNNTFYILMK